jgi:hypothetical protein
MAVDTLMNHPAHRSKDNLPQPKGATLVQRALTAAFGIPEKSVIASPFQQPEVVRNSAAILSFDSSVASTRALAHGGFRYIRPFVVLPSIAEPRWLLPENNSRQAVRGLKLYTPFSTRTRVLKALGTGIAAAGFPGHSRSRVIVASREFLPIENLVRGLTQEARPGFAISIGTPITCQKLTVQAMSPAGDILVYIKISLGPEAESRIQAEAAILEKLSAFPQMRARIPRLLSTSDLGAGKFLVQSHLPGRPGPTLLTRLHGEFLRDLHSCGCLEWPGEAVVAETSAVWKKLAKGLNSPWQNLSREAFGLAARELAGKRLTCAPMHGDFAPWNSRAHCGQLFCFDWESANWQAPIHWDRFHFLAQTHSLTNTGAGPESLPETRDGARASFILYLLYSVAQLAAENSAPATLEYREQLLRRQLSGEMAGAPSQISKVVAGATQKPTLNQEHRLDD